MEELISIIIPIYNSEKYIKRCIDSIINQSYKNIEIILIDDGSTDNSRNICEKYSSIDSRFKILSKKNGGVSSARNVGVKNAKGEYIMFVDADDWLEKDAIITLYNTLKEHNVDIVRGNFYCNNDKRNFKIEIQNKYENIKIKKNDKKLKIEIINDLLLGKLKAFVWLLLIKKEIIVSNKILFNTNISFMEDLIFYIRLISIDNISFYMLDKDIYCYYFNNNSASKSKSQNKIIENIENVLSVNKIVREILYNSKMLNEETQTRMCTANFNIIMNYYFSLYKVNKIKNLKEFLEKIIENKEFEFIMKNINYRFMPIHYRLQYFITKYKKIDILIFYYKIRKIFSLIKDIIKRR